MSRQTKQPNRTDRLENRMDRVERMLEQLAERQIHAENRQDRTQLQLDQLGERVDQMVGAVNLLAALQAPPGVNLSGDE